MVTLRTLDFIAPTAEQRNNVWRDTCRGRKMVRFYRLDENDQPVPVDDVTEAEWNDRWHLVDEPHGFYVSTVFLPLDHSFHPPDLNAPPIIFETMIFDKRKRRRGRRSPVGDPDVYQERYSNVESARAGHRRALAWLEKHKDDNPMPYGPDPDEDDDTLDAGLDDVFKTLGLNKELGTGEEPDAGTRHECNPKAGDGDGQD